MQKKQIYLRLSLLLIVGIAAVYLVLYRPLVSDLEVIKADLEIARLEYTAKQSRIETLGSLEKEIGIIKKGIKDTVPVFYGKTAQEELIIKIDDFCTASETRLLGIEYSGLSEFPIEVTAAGESTKADGETEADKAILYGDVFTVEFIGTYEKILAMLRLIDSNNKAIVNMGLEIGTQLNVRSYIPEELASAYPNKDFEALIQEEGALSCKIQLVFFQMEGLDEYVIPDYNILKEEPREQSASENPFEVYTDEILARFKEQ